jgi:hypothetical protein
VQRQFSRPPTSHLGIASLSFKIPQGIVGSRRSEFFNATN